MNGIDRLIDSIVKLMSFDFKSKIKVPETTDEDGIREDWKNVGSDLHQAIGLAKEKKND